MRKANFRKAFTLIELMVVVAIIAILAAIAIPQYKNYQLKAKTAEAKMNIGAIRTSEEAYAAENNYYVATNWEPATVPGVTPANFNATTTNGFAYIGFEPSGKVYFSYAVTDSNNNTAAAATDADGTLQGTQLNVTTGTDIYIWAIGDLDGDAGNNVTPSLNCANCSQFYATDEDPKVVDNNPGHF